MTEDEDERLIFRLNRAANEIHRLEMVIETFKCGLRTIIKTSGGEKQMRYEATETLRVAESVARGE